VSRLPANGVRWVGELTILNRINRVIDEATRDPDRASETRAAFVHMRACQEGPQDSPQGSLLLSSETGERGGFCLYTRQGVRIVCEARKDEQSEMKWVKRFIVFLVVGFALFYLVAYPEAAADAVRAVAAGLAVVFRSVLIFFQALAN